MPYSMARLSAMSNSMLAYGGRSQGRLQAAHFDVLMYH